MTKHESVFHPTQAKSVRTVNASDGMSNSGNSLSLMDGFSGVGVLIEAWYALIVCTHNCTIAHDCCLQSFVEEKKGEATIPSAL